MGHKSYFIDLAGAENVRVRVSIKTELGRVIDLVIQLEIWTNGRWQTVSRYDCAHGGPHLDLIHKGGERKKVYLSHASLKNVVNAAIDDFKNNWELHIRRAGYVEEK